MAIIVANGRAEKATFFIIISLLEHKGWPLTVRNTLQWAGVTVLLPPTAAATRCHYSDMAPRKQLHKTRARLFLLFILVVCLCKTRLCR